MTPFFRALPLSLLFAVLIWLPSSWAGGFITSNGMSLPVGLICELPSGEEIQLMPEAENGYILHRLQRVSPNAAPRTVAQSLACQADPFDSSDHQMENLCFSSEYEVRTLIFDGKLYFLVHDKVSGQKDWWPVTLSGCRIEVVYP